MPYFEFDHDKSDSNRIKHGINFEDAQALWNDDYVEIESNQEGEKRYLHIGKIGADIWTAIVTYRDANIIRIISVRRSRKSEVSVYEN